MRAIREARTWEDADGNVAILIPAEHATGFQTPHTRTVPGGVIFALDQASLADAVVNTLRALELGGDSTLLRRRTAVLRRMIGDARWEEAESAYLMAKTVAGPAVLQ